MSGADLVNFNALQKKKRILTSAFYLTLTLDSIDVNCLRLHNSYYIF